MTKVIKRDCTEVDFQKEKISSAILRAMKNGSGIVKPKIAEDIAEEIYEETKERDEISISEIENLVYDKLISKKQRLTAKAYEGYRSIREFQRENTNTTDEQIMELLKGESTYWNEENSNKNPVLANVQRDYLAGILSTDITRRYLLSPEIVQAHDEGLIHFHDADYFAQDAIHNCELINAEDILQNGTVINGVTIDKPHRIITASTILTQVITAVTSSSYGGATINLAHLAPFVRDSYNLLLNKHRRRNHSEDDCIKYAKEDLASMAYKNDLCERLEGEGAVLLMNENNALPLEKGASVSTFSNSSVNLVYGGTGSGGVDASTAPTLKESLTDSGFKVNETLWTFYTEGAGSEYVRGRSTLDMSGSGDAATTGEVPWDVYTEDVLGSVASYGDAAIVTFSRVGGEGADLTFKDNNYLALDDNEKAMLENLAKMKADGTIKKIIVLINSANTLQVDFLANESYAIDACLWIGDVGQTGINGVADILAGEVNPSGSLAATYLYDNYSSPAMVNMATTQYANADTVGLPDTSSRYYVVYQEGIYVGYRYYETRYEDVVMGTGNAGDFDYHSDVAYPFGYGLSYTDFTYSNMSTVYNPETDQFEVTVTVTNTGDTYSGKETVWVMTV